MLLNISTVQVASVQSCGWGLCLLVNMYATVLAVGSGPPLVIAAWLDIDLQFLRLLLEVQCCFATIPCTAQPGVDSTFYLRLDSEHDARTFTACMTSFLGLTGVHHVVHVPATTVLKERDKDECSVLDQFSVGRMITWDSNFGHQISPIWLEIM